MPIMRMTVARGRPPVRDAVLRRLVGKPWPLLGSYHAQLDVLQDATARQLLTVR